MSVGYPYKTKNDTFGLDYWVRVRWSHPSQNHLDVVSLFWSQFETVLKWKRFLNQQMGSYSISVSVWDHYHGYWDWDGFLNLGPGEVTFQKYLNSGNTLFSSKIATSHNNSPLGHTRGYMKLATPRSVALGTRVSIFMTRSRPILSCTQLSNISTVTENEYIHFFSRSQFHG